jgi:hypothetical protein
MRPVNDHPTISNGIMYLTLTALFALIGGMISEYIMYFGFAIAIALIIGWALSYKFNNFMDNRIKILQYIKYDFLNGPIYYVIAAGCWIVTIINSIADYSRYGYIEFDMWLALTCIYFISCVMVLWGYTKDYDRLK